MLHTLQLTAGSCASGSTLYTVYSLAYTAICVCKAVRAAADAHMQGATVMDDQRVTMDSIMDDGRSSLHNNLRSYQLCWQHPVRP
jgi:hypothetical protein